MISPTIQTSPRIYARAAGIAFLLYIAADITGMALTGPSHVADVFSLLGSFSALVLAVTLYMITREQGTRSCNAGLDLPRGRVHLWLQPWRNLLRRGQHAVLLASAPRADDPRRTGLAGCDCVSAARRDPAPATRRTVRWLHVVGVLGHLACMAAHVGVRDNTGAVVDDQRRRATGDTPSFTVTQ
jgi:hypothetical protein